MILKILIAVALAAGVGNVVQFFMAKWQAASYEAKIVKLENEQTNLKISLEKAQAEKQYGQAQTKAKAKVRYVEKQTDAIVGSGDDAAMRKLFIERGMLREGGKGQAPGDGGKGGPGDKSAAPPRAAPIQR